MRVTSAHLRHRRRPAADASPTSLGKLRPVFAARGSVTAGNSSQMSDGRRRCC